MPYQLLIAIGFVLFPMLARKKAENDLVAVRLYTRIPPIVITQIASW